MIDRHAPLTDNSPCPFGKHKGKPLRRVPLWYWHWFIVQEFCGCWPALEAWALKKCGHTFTDRPAIEHKPRKHGKPLPLGKTITGADYVPWQGDPMEAPF
jgi:hypothetical protein